MEVLRVLHPGLGSSFQDAGRPGWRRFGVPVGGAMDAHAAMWANRLLDNPPGAEVLELLLQGARFLALHDVWVAVTGADANCIVPVWRATRLSEGQIIGFPKNVAGVWTYLAVEGGFAAPTILGSVSVNGRAGLGSPLRAGDELRALAHRAFSLPQGVSGRIVPALERPNYSAIPFLRVWPGPQASAFTVGDRTRLFEQSWHVSPQSDRVGYRLVGTPFESRPGQIISEPVRVGTIQVPENGLPIVTMRDGPTVGGYSKIGVLEPADVSVLAQCRPGQEIRFRSVDETGSEL